VGASRRWRYAALTRGGILVICNDSAYFLRHRRPIVGALVAAGHAVTVMTGGPAIPPEAAVGWTAINIPIARFSFDPVADFNLAWRTFRLILSSRPEGLHLITLKPSVVSGLAALAARLVCGRPLRILITIPGLGRLMSPGSRHRGLKARFARSAVARVIRLLSRRRGVRFSFETDSDRRNWLDGRLIGKDNAFVINGAGVDESLFYPSDESAPGRRLRVLFASRLLGSKGLDAFIDAAHRLSNRGFEFVVAGMVEGHDPDGFFPERLRRDDAILFAGEVSDMPVLLRSVDIVCLPTRYGEGIPRILIEAAACGLPSIASDLDGCREIVKDGVSGVTIPVADARTMADGIEAALLAYQADPGMLRRHGQAARDVFRAGGFSEQTVVDQFVSLLTKD